MMIRPISPALTGRVIGGRYHVGFPLEPGRHDWVCHARDLATDRPVSILFVHDCSLTSRSAELARAATQLESPHVVRVRDVGALQSPMVGTYIVLDPIHGASLRAVLDTSGPCRVAEAVRWIRAVCRGLAEAHSFGLCHGHLRPESVFVERRSGGDFVQVLGCGVPEMRSAASIMSIAYRAPEQSQLPHRLDPRSDVWAVGAILYELLTGTPPFCAATLPELERAIRRAHPAPLSAARPEIDPSLERIVLRCLAKDPEERHRSVNALADELALFESEPVILDRPSQVSKRDLPLRSSLAPIASALLCVGIGAAASLGLASAARQSATVQPVLEPPEVFLVPTTDLPRGVYPAQQSLTDEDTPDSTPERSVKTASARPSFLRESAPPSGTPVEDVRVRERRMIDQHGRVLRVEREILQ